MTKITIEVTREVICVRCSLSTIGHSTRENRRVNEPTDEVGVIRREFIVQLDGVRFVDGVPERGPASNNGVDVFRIGGPETTGHGGVEGSHLLVGRCEDFNR
jgi:hypothetical protein